MPRLSTALSHKPELESKICEWCEKVFYRHKEAKAQWEAKRTCCRSHAGYLAVKNGANKGPKGAAASIFPPRKKSPPKVKQIGPSEYEREIDRLIAPIFAE